MQVPRPIVWIILAGCILLAIIFLLFPSSVPQLVRPADEHPTVYLIYASAGSMPQLLNTGQIDGFMVWEPVVSNAELAGIGKRVAVPSNLPPPGKWEDAASCVLVLRNDFIQKYPDQSALISALTTAAINRTNSDPDLARQVTADWVFGRNPVLTPTGSLSPLDIENRSFENMVFTADALPPESGLVSSITRSKSGGSYEPAGMMVEAVRSRGGEFLNGSASPVITGEIPELNIGYLPSSDNFAPLYVMVKDSQYFCDRYGFCLVPDDPAALRPDSCTLLAGGGTVARVSLLQAQSGGGIMTTIGQEALDGAYVGSVPASLQIALGNPSSIIQSINTGGTGLVVDPHAPCDDWKSFINWTKSRSARGRPVIIATIQSSIQEDMTRGALAYENISVIMYGTDIKTEYS